MSGLKIMKCTSIDLLNKNNLKATYILIFWHLNYTLRFPQHQKLTPRIRLFINFKYLQNLFTIISYLLGNVITELSLPHHISESRIFRSIRNNEK